MKRFAFFGTAILLVVFTAGVTFAQEVYWESAELDETITDDDFQKDYGRPILAPSLGDKDVYDNFVVPDIDPRVEPDEVPAAPVQTRTPDVPARTEPAARPAEPSPRPREIAPRQRETRRPAAGPRPAETAPGAGPSSLGRPEQTAPGRGLEDDLRQPSGTPAPAPAPDAASSRKMKWGQVDVKPAEPQTQPQSGATPAPIR